MNIYKKDDKLLINSDHKVIKCETCPCNTAEPTIIKPTTDYILIIFNKAGHLGDFVSQDDGILLIWFNIAMEDPAFKTTYNWNISAYYYDHPELKPDFSIYFYPEINLNDIISSEYPSVWNLITKISNGTYSILNNYISVEDNIYTLIDKQDIYLSSANGLEYEYQMSIKFDNTLNIFTLNISTISDKFDPNKHICTMHYCNALSCVEFNILLVVDSQNACLTPDTLIIMADGSEKAIKDIQKNEYIRSIDQKTGLYIEDKVLFNRYAYHRKRLSYDKWVFLNGVILKTIGPHRMYNVDRQAFIYMHLWKIGLSVQFANGSVSKLVLHLVVNELTICCSLITKNLTYIANGMLTGTRNANSKTPFNVADFL